MALAEPSRLTKPLPGGREGATVVLHPLVCALMDSPAEFMAMTGGKLGVARKFLGSKDDWIKLPIPAFLVEHPGVGPIIIDTGFHPSVAVDPKQNLGPRARAPLQHRHAARSRRSRRSCASRRASTRATCGSRS